MTAYNRQFSPERDINKGERGVCVHEMERESLKLFENSARKKISTEAITNKKNVRARRRSSGVGRRTWGTGARPKVSRGAADCPSHDQNPSLMV